MRAPLFRCLLLTVLAALPAQAASGGYVNADWFPEVGPATFSLKRAGVLVGLIVDAGGSPDATTDDEGRYRLTGLSPGSYQVAAESGELQASVQAPVEIRAAVQRLDLEFEDGLTLSGHVLLDGEPLAFEGLQVLTTEDGAFQVSRCIAGSYRLRVHADGFPLAEAHVLVPPGGTVHTEIALETKP